MFTDPPTLLNFVEPTSCFLTLKVSDDVFLHSICVGSQVTPLRMECPVDYREKIIASVWRVRVNKQGHEQSMEKIAEDVFDERVKYNDPTVEIFMQPPIHLKPSSADHYLLKIYYTSKGVYRGGKLTNNIKEQLGGIFFSYNLSSTADRWSNSSVFVSIRVKKKNMPQ